MCRKKIRKTKEREKIDKLCNSEPTSCWYGRVELGLVLWFLVRVSNDKNKSD